MLRASIRRLEVFVAAAEAGSFVAAAQQLGIEQPSVSEHIRALEADLGQALFERRRGRPSRLTEAGQALVVRARTLLAEAEELSAEMGRRRSDARREVVLSCQRLVANVVLPASLAAFLRSHPELGLTVRTATQEEVFEHLFAGIADLGCFLSNTPPEGLVSEKIGEERLVLVAAPSHPLAGRRRIPPRELEAHRFVRGPASSLLGREFDRILADIGITRTPVASRTTEYNMGRELVAAGVGLLFTLARSVAPDLASGVLVELSLDAPPQLFIGVRQAYSPRRPPSAAARLLAAHLGGEGGR
jgi:LysR family transcriptional regulator, low CO2-responsive transcriptional regulator